MKELLFLDYRLPLIYYGSFSHESKRKITQRSTDITKDCNDHPTLLSFVIHHGKFEHVKLLKDPLYRNQPVFLVCP